MHVTILATASLLLSGASATPFRTRGLDRRIGDKFDITYARGVPPENPDDKAYEWFKLVPDTKYAFKGPEIRGHERCREAEEKIAEEEPRDKTGEAGGGGGAVKKKTGDLYADYFGKQPTDMGLRGGTAQQIPRLFKLFTAKLSGNAKEKWKGSRSDKEFTAAGETDYFRGEISWDLNSEAGSVPDAQKGLIVDALVSQWVVWGTADKFKVDLYKVEKTLGDSLKPGFLDLKKGIKGKEIKIGEDEHDSGDDVYRIGTLQLVLS